ncbi:MAG: hypothetical protein HN472_14940 [Nitrospina sp.]|jgi:hypothetical protein|nr:hypothetical protein [Nitrospina sp.]MBT3510829.1 hypothetical protein [Nitrospina sp.]MBT3875428.1 hypothetical protein [Nitrospina sp.]MBT4047323.1 hypothetical protein [Nitrospina sp.]MBT4557979.1 hypothetical protein [Nitrospina sp.]
MYKQLLGAIAIGLTIIAYFPYIRSIIQGKTRPHVFSWVIWGTSTSIVFLAQLADKGGAGAWVIGVSGVISIYVAILAYIKRSDSTITRMDWLFFILAMASLPLWYLTSDPLWAVVLLTTVDVLGFGPTFRRAYARPFDEQLMFFVIMIARNFIVVLALENYSLTTVLFPATIAAVCVIFSLMVAYRRRVVA